MLDLNKTLLPKMKDGEYTVAIKDWSHETTVPDIQGNVKDRLEFTVSFPDRDVKIVVFPGQYDYVFGCLRRQLEKQDAEISVQDLLDASIGEPIKMQVEWSTVYNTFNYAWTPKPEDVTEEDVAVATEGMVI